LRRIIIIGTAVAVLVSASAASAALNKYGADFKFTPTTAGSASKPVPVGFVQTLAVASVQCPGDPGTKASLNCSIARPAPLVDIKTTIYGLVSNAKYFPKCSAAKIESNHLKWDKACPKGSLVATANVDSSIGPDTTLVGAGAPCHPFLSVYNGGPGLLVYFFSVTPQAPGHACVTLKTGAAAPYFGKVTQQGKNLVQDVPLPPDVSTEAGGLKGAYGSLIFETLKWRKLTTKVHGKTVGFQSSVACKRGKRPWSVKYTAVNQGVKQPPITVPGSNKC
jgi:hypothetical protein